MKNTFLLKSNESFVEKNIYANRSSIVLEWLLRVGIHKEYFSLREVARETEVSFGLVCQVFNTLALQGFLQIEGQRTSKRFLMKKAEELLRSWLEQYDICKKCKMWTYRSGFGSREELLQALKTSSLQSQTVLALHSAAEAHGYKHTHLNTLELYLKDLSVKEELEKVLKLVPQERGYEVLLIQPYYKSLLNMQSSLALIPSSILLTFLDLYHFPLRGIEQAEWMAERNLELRHIYQKK
ncbi:type IV toxin-antitoxin system AbiEi family antitoxin [Rhabdochlamydiaceae symbiont of Dictyostelium giganteum]|uniref:type IV toxin-antitoxin system AbiEi family antitoxin n=1 Tax=Rhabdochlamydiaceae symbiont of Dictyostelium giganteum TaxID=3342349 RepID=UPI00384D6D5B